MNPIIIPLTALSIPILAILLGHFGKSQKNKQRELELKKEVLLLEIEKQKNEIFLLEEENKKMDKIIYEGGDVSP
ncbi:MAG: hypothetical protein FWH12_06705 [Treponema sp.]|nr:hypothetical protein [Treponema sp.]